MNSRSAWPLIVAPLGIKKQHDDYKETKKKLERKRTRSITRPYH
jgi:hypothetical protein